MSVINIKIVLTKIIMKYGSVVCDGYPKACVEVRETQKKNWIIPFKGKRFNV